MSRRRLLIVAAVAGTLAMTGCRAQPNMAVYLGNTSYSMSAVDKMVDEFPAATRERQRNDLRAFVVRELTERDLTRRIASERGTTVPLGDVSRYSSFAEQYGLPATGALLHLIADAEAGMTTIKPFAKPQAPTEADRREVFADLVATQAVSADAYDQIKSQLDSQELQAALGERAVLESAIKKYSVTSNPMLTVFLPLSYTLAGGQVNGTLRVPVGGTSDAVKDVSPTVPASSSGSGQ